MSNIELNDGNIQPSRNFPAISYIAEADSDWVAKPSESIHPMPVCAVCGQNVPADLLKDQESNAGNESLQ